MTVSMEYERSDTWDSSVRPGCPPWAAGADEGGTASDFRVEGVLACGC
ncbi:hypothetical protein [Actinomyces gerencseriae]|nr:hypothetical protein [Actinomyces gerencseriae]